MCAEVQLRVGGEEATQASSAKPGQAVLNPNSTIAGADANQGPTTTWCSPDAILPGAQPVCTAKDEPSVGARMCRCVPSYAKEVPGCVQDVTNQLHRMSVEDKCVYEPSQEYTHTHTETRRQRAGMRCATHCCALRLTWTRTSVWVEGRQSIKRLGVRLSWGCAKGRKTGQSPNLSTLTSSMQAGNGQLKVGFGKKRKRETIC